MESVVSGNAVSVTNFTVDSDLQNFGRVSLADVFGDRVIYRNLEPLEKGMRGFKSLAYQLDLVHPQQIPRKTEPDYAQVAHHILTESQRRRGERSEIQEMLLIGDSFYSDGQCYLNLRNLSGWRSSCFIGSDQLEAKPSLEIENHRICSANRWSALSTWLEWLEQENFHLDSRTVVIVDIDKTAIGAAGRNDGVIDRIRLEAGYETMSSLLGEDTNRAKFEQLYAALDGPTYHNLTADNQDYLAYICLVINAGLMSYDEVTLGVEQGRIENFEQFTRLVSSRMMMGKNGKPAVGEALRQVHDAVIMCLSNGDPTPFKRFRRQEFISTTNRMGHLPDETPTTSLLAEEVTINYEVYALSQRLQEQGCLLFCLSDKPDEASYPNRRNARSQQPIHHLQTHAVGMTG